MVHRNDSSDVNIYKNVTAEFMLSAQGCGGQEHGVFIIFLQVLVQSAAGLDLYFELFLCHQFHVCLCSFESTDVEMDQALKL